ncbi:MAG: YebC/PmpR family DNA-binding transcriptional regulator [Bdellovibrionota bacterium]
MGRGWANAIREVNAAKKGKVFTKIAREITVAVKLGGADPESNPRLRMALKDGRENSMPKDTIDRAVKRATGEGSEAAYEENIYEGYGPHGVAMLVETLTDNKNRTVQDLRAIFVRGGGNLGEPGSVFWMFDKVGSVIAKADKPGLDAEEAAINAGADEVNSLDEGQFQFICGAADVDSVQHALSEQGWKVLKYEISYKSKTPSELTSEQETDLRTLMDKIDDHDDVKKIHLSV